MERSSSCGSGSSGGSAFTSRSGASKAVNDAEKDNLLEQQNQTAQTALFGMLYTLAKEKLEGNPKFALLNIMIEFLLILLLFMTEGYPWASDPSNGGRWSWLFKAFSYLDFQNPVADAGYTVFVVFFYLLGGVLAISIGICLWVGWCFMADSFPFTWPIKVARLVVSVFVSMFFISSLNIFFTSCQCAVRNGVWVHTLYNVNCLEMPHVIHICFSVVFASLFIALGLLVEIADHDLEPLTTNLLASPSSMCEVRCLIARIGLTLADPVLKNTPHAQCIVFCVCSGLIVYWHLRWMPHYTAWVNCLRAGLHSAVAWMALMMVVITYSVTWTYDANYKPHWEEMDKRVTITALMGAGMPIAFLAGCAAAYVRLYYSWRVALKFKEWVPTINPRRLHYFLEDFDVEVAARCLMRAWIDKEEGIVDPVALDLAENVLKAGLVMQPDSAYLHIVYSNFLIDVRHNVPAGWSHLEQAKRCNPNLSQQFSIFTRQQQHKQRSAAGGEDEEVDLVSYVEFQKNYKSLLVYHKAALMAARGFWRLLMRESIPLEGLLTAVQKIDTMEGLAAKTYKLVLDRYPRNARLLRSYGKFLEHVKNDPWGAARYYSEAEKQEELAETKVAVSGEAGSLMSKEDLRAAAVVTCNSTGVITSANGAAHEMFGYKNGDLEGKNVAALCPPPFSVRHASYMRAYAATGRAKILGSPREVLGLHKERHVFPITVTISKVSGSGADATFMGMIKPVEVRTDEMKLWMSVTGTVLCADAAFLDAMGWAPSELLGKSFASLGAGGCEPELEKCVELAAELDEEELKSGAVTAVAPLTHKYGEDMVMSMKFEMGGTTNQRILMVLLRSTKPLPLAAAVDSSGAVLWVSGTLSTALGYKSRALVGKEMGTLLPAPYGALHTKWLKDLEHHPSKPGPGSCRARAAVPLLTANGGIIPVRMSMAQRTQGMDNLWYMSFTRLPPFAQQDERRLQLRVDSEGVVVAVSGATPPSTFDAEPHSLVGLGLEELVDAFSEYADTGGDVPTALAALCARSASHSGSSWRVAVGTCIGEGAAAVAAQQAAAAAEAEEAARRSGRFLLSINSSQKGKPIPAIMTVVVPDADQEEELAAAGLGAPTGVEGPAPLVTLWRTDMMAAVAELTAGPVIARADPALGLILGRASVALLSHHLYKFLVLPAETTLDELMGAAAKKKGGMKKARLGRVGPRRMLSGLHPDGRAVTVTLQASPKDSTSTDRLVVLVRPVGAVGAIPRLLDELVETMEAEDNGAGGLDGHGGNPGGSEQDSEAALQAATQTLSTLGRGTMVPRLPLNKLGLGSTGGAVTTRRSMPGMGDLAATARGVDLDLGSGRPRETGSMLGAPPIVRNVMSSVAGAAAGSELGVYAGAVPGGSDDMGGSEGFAPRDMDLSSDSDSPGPTTQLTPAALAKGPAKRSGTKRQHMTEEEAEAALARQGAKKVAEWLSSGFTFKKEGEDSGDHDRRALLPGAVPEEEEEEEAGGPGAMVVVKVAAKGGAGAKEGAKGKAGSLEGGSVDGGTTVLTSTTGAEGEKVNDFSRGKRLKRLLRLLNGAAAQATILAFRLRVLLLTLALGGLHVVLFAVLMSQLASSYTTFTELRPAGQSLVLVHEVSNFAMVLDAAQRGWGYGPADIPYYVDEMTEHTQEFDESHNGQYLGFDTLRSIANPKLRSLWHDPTLTATQYGDEASGNAGTTTNITTSLFNLGAEVAAAAREVIYIASKNTTVLHANAHWNYLVNNAPGALYNAYIRSWNMQIMDAREAAQNLQTVALVLLVLEGVLLMLCGVGGLVALLRRVSSQRAALFSVFLAVPQLHLRSLASKSVNIGEDEEEGAGGEERARDKAADKAVAVAAHAEGPDAPSSKTAKGPKAGARDQADAEEDEEGGDTAKAEGGKNKKKGGKKVKMEEGAKGNKRSTKSKGGDSGKGGPGENSLFNGKMLVTSARAAYDLAWPYALYAAVVMAFYLATYLQLNDLVSVMGRTKLAHRALGQGSRVEFAAVRVALTANVTARPTYQAQLLKEVDMMNTIWNRLLYGGPTLPDGLVDGANDDYPGSLFADPDHVGFLFKDKGCFREDMSTCLQPDDPLYPITTGPLDSLMQRMLLEATLLASDDPATITPDSSRYKYIWGPARLDLHIRMQALAHDFLDDGLNALLVQRTNHIVLLLLSVLALGGFVVMKLRPWVAALGKEGRRVAELLVQLPGEVDAEGLVEASLAPQSKGAGGGDPSAPQRSMSLGGALMSTMRSALGSFSGPQPIGAPNGQWGPAYYGGPPPVATSPNRRSLQRNGSWVGAGEGGSPKKGRRPGSPGAGVTSSGTPRGQRPGSPRGGGGKGVRRAAAVEDDSAPLLASTPRSTGRRGGGTPPMGSPRGGASPRRPARNAVVPLDSKLRRSQ